MRRIVQAGVVVLLGCGPLLSGCGPEAAPSSPSGGSSAPAASTPTSTSTSTSTATSTSTSPSTATPTSPASSTSQASEPPSNASKKPLDITSQCTDVVQVVFGDDPKSGGKRPVAPSGTIDAPRRPDGTQVVWLLDDQGEGIIKVQITRHMKHVDIGRSCRTMDAH